MKQKVNLSCRLCKDIGLLFLLPALALSGMLASCSQEELPATDVGTPLPEGKYLLVLTASVGEMQTRSAGKDTWTENDPIGVRIGDAGAKVGKYLVKSDESTQPASERDALYWQNTASADITAWYPYEAQTNVDISDQRGGYTNFDFLRAEIEADYKTQGIELQFKHQMAKVKYTLIHGEGMDEAALQNADVAISGYTKATFSEGVLTSSESENGWITPTTDGEALLVPQGMSGKPFIKVSIMVDGTSRDFVYTPEDGAANLESGYAYTYTITVKRTGIEVNAMCGEWSDNEENGDAEEATFSLYLHHDTSVPNTSGFEVTDENGTVLIANNNVYSTQSSTVHISLSVNEGYCLKTFIARVVGGICQQNYSFDADTRTYVYTLHDIRSDLYFDPLVAEAEKNAGSVSEPNIGDYYYVDGTWSSELQKPCIGIVFKVESGTGDDASNYGDKLADKKIHGYVVALQDAHEAVGIWGIRNQDVGNLPNEESFTDKYNGYANTQTVKALPEFNEVDLANPLSKDQYWAFKAASDYAANAPANSSGWYLPSIGQLQDIYNLSNRAELLTKAGGTDFKTSENDGRYWSSTEYNGSDAWYYRFNGNGSERYAKGVEYQRYCYVRAVLTF